MNKKQYHLFWGGPFSNWAYAPFTVDGYEYTCSEQHMMHQKALFFGDEEAAKAIMATESPSEQKSIGRKVKNFDANKWNAVSRELVYKGCMAKFTQNEEFKEFMLGTGNDVIVEASPYDKIWGIGLGEDDPRALDESQWQGTNWLGEVLMKVRATLRGEPKGDWS